MNRNWIPALTLGLALLAVPVLAAAQSAGTQSATPQNAAIPRPAPDAKFLTMDGKTVSLSDYKGKVVLLDFWATWCGPCRMAMPGLQKMHESMKSKGLVVLGVSLDRNPPVQVPPFLLVVTVPKLLAQLSASTEVALMFALTAPSATVIGLGATTSVGVVLVRVTVRVRSAEYRTGVPWSAAL